MTVLDRYAAVDSAAVSDALDQLGLPAGIGGIRPVWGSATVVGFAVTVELGPWVDGPAGAHIATTAIETADVDGASFGHWGEVLTVAAQYRGVAGLLIDGGVRDAAGLAALGFPVFSRNNSILGTRKDFAGVHGQPVTVGVPVHTGDLIVGDVDGTAHILDQADARVAHETEVMAQLPTWQCPASAGAAPAHRFTNIEGNVAPEDCFLSRQVITHGHDNDETFLARFAERVGESRFPAASLPHKVRAGAVKPIFKSIVDFSDHGDLLSSFLALPVPKMFMYGEKNNSLSYLRTLAAGGVELAEIDHSGHFPMYSNPPAMWAHIAGLVARAATGGPG